MQAPGFRVPSTRCPMTKKAHVFSIFIATLAVATLSAATADHRHPGDGWSDHRVDRRRRLLHQRPADVEGQDLARPQRRRPAAQLAHGAGDLRRPQPRDARSLVVPGRSGVGRGPQHPRIRRRDARVAAARSPGLHPQPPGRQPRGLLQGAAVAQLGLRRRRHASPRLRSASRTGARRSRPPGHGRHPRPLLLRPGPAAARRGGGRDGGGRRGELGPEQGLPERHRRNRQRGRYRVVRPPDPEAGSGHGVDRAGATDEGRRPSAAREHESRGEPRAGCRRHSRVRLRPAARQRRFRPEPHRRDGQRGPQVARVHGETDRLQRGRPLRLRETPEQLRRGDQRARVVGLLRLPPRR